MEFTIFSLDGLIVILLDGLFYASWVFTVSLGLTLIYGVMRILNIAHGSLYALGAYAAASSLNFYLSGEWPPGFKSLAEKMELYFDTASLSPQFRYILWLLLSMVLIYFFTRLITSKVYINLLKALAAVVIAIGAVFLAIKFLLPLTNQEALPESLAFFSLPLLNQLSLPETMPYYVYQVSVCILALVLVVVLVRFVANVYVANAWLVLLLTLGLMTAASFFLLPFFPEAFSLQLPLLMTEVPITLPYFSIGVFIIVLVFIQLMTSEFLNGALRALVGVLIALGTAVITTSLLLPLAKNLPPPTLLSSGVYMATMTSIIIAVACALLAAISTIQFLLLCIIRTSSKLYTRLLDVYLLLLVLGFYLAGRFPEASSYLVLFIAALTIGIVFGILVERGALRFMHQHNEVVMVLVTYAIFLILEDIIKLIWGVDSYYAYQPYNLLGSVDIYGVPYSNYEFLRIAIALLSGIIVWWGLNKTRQGKQLLAVIHDREMSQAFGVNVTGVFAFTFVVGAFLAALAGAFTAPAGATSLGIGVEVIVLAFAVVVIGGLGSIQGALIGALMVGLARAAAVHLFPEAELFVIYSIMAIVLVMRPRGLFALREGRKI